MKNYTNISVLTLSIACLNFLGVNKSIAQSKPDIITAPSVNYSTTTVKVVDRTWAGPINSPQRPVLSFNVAVEDAKKSLISPELLIITLEGPNNRPAFTKRILQNNNQRGNTITIPVDILKSEFSPLPITTTYYRIRVDALSGAVIMARCETPISHFNNSKWVRYANIIGADSINISVSGRTSTARQLLTNQAVAYRDQKIWGLILEGHRLATNTHPHPTSTRISPTTTGLNTKVEVQGYVEGETSTVNSLVNKWKFHISHGLKVDKWTQTSNPNVFNLLVTNQNGTINYSYTFGLTSSPNSYQLLQEVP